MAESFDAVLADIRETAKVGHTVESRGMAFAADPCWLDDWADRLQSAHEAEVVAAQARLVAGMKSFLAQQGNGEQGGRP